jgi:hypothetical protein
MSDKKNINTLKKKSVLAILISLIIVSGFFTAMELLAPDNVKPSILVGLREKVEPMVELEEDQKEGFEVGNYEECRNEGGVTSVTEDGQEICTFEEGSYVKKKEEQEKTTLNDESGDDSEKSTDVTSLGDSIIYTNPSFPNMQIPYKSDWSLSVSDERSRGTGLYALELSKGYNILRIEINSFPQTSFPTTCFRSERSQILEQIRVIDYYHNSTRSEGNTFFDPVKVYKIKDPSEKEGYDFQYKALKEVTEDDRNLIRAGNGFIIDCTMESEYKEAFILTEVSGTDNSFYAEVAFYLQTEEPKIVSEADNLIKNSKL